MQVYKSRIFIFIMLCFSISILPKTRILPMPGVVNPDELQVLGGKMYVGEFPQVHIYFTRFRFKAMGHLLVWADMGDFQIYLWDSIRDRVVTIQKDYDPVKVTKQDIKEYHRYLNRPRTRELSQRIKPYIKFPDYFPPVKGCEVSADKIYVYTYRKNQTGTEFFIFNDSGQLLAKNRLPLQGGIRPEQYSFCFGNDTLYQLVESGSGEDWELHITKVKTP